MYDEATHEHWVKLTPYRRIGNTHKRNSPHSPCRRKRINRKLSSSPPPPPFSREKKVNRIRYNMNIYA